MSAAFRYKGRTRTLAAALSLTLCGCSVAVTGAQTTGAGTSHIGAATATQGQVRIGNNAAVAASFGTPPPAGAAGARVSLSRGAAGVFILGLVLADFVHALASPAGERGAALDPNRPIAHTCSCYGYVAPQQLTAATGEE